MLQQLTKNPKDRFLPSDCYMRSRIKHAIKTMENRKEMPLNHGIIMRDLLLKFYQANGNPSMSDVIWATDLEEGRPLVFEYDGGVEENDVVELYCWLYDSNRLCNMNSLKNTNPRSFIIQNHNKGTHKLKHASLANKGRDLREMVSSQYKCGPRANPNGTRNLNRWQRGRTERNPAWPRVART